MKTCHHCRLDIPLSASVCPGCLDNDPGGSLLGSLNILIEWCLGIAIFGLFFLWLFG